MRLARKSSEAGGYGVAGRVQQVLEQVSPHTLVLTTVTGSGGPRPHHQLAHSGFSVHKLEVLERGDRCFGVTEMSQHINVDSTVI